MRHILFAAALVCIAPALAEAAPQYRINGKVQAPNGAAANDIVVVACGQPYDQCDERKLRIRANYSGGDTASFAMDVPGPGPYRMVFWRDVNRNDTADPGDFIGLLRGGDGVMVTPNQPLETGTSRLAVYKVSTANGGGGGGGAGGGNPGGLSGSWGQRSNSSELTLTPKIKIMPSMSATGFGVGTTGYGAGQTTTTIQNEYSSVQTDRSMQLNVRPDGGFTWTIDKSRAASPSTPNCKIITHEEKTGVIQTSGNQVRFQINGGTQSSRNTCDASKSSSSGKSPSSESYTYAVAGSTLRISGSGGVNWVFNRR